MAWQGVSQFQTQTGDSNNNIASSPNSTSLTRVGDCVSGLLWEVYSSLWLHRRHISIKTTSNTIDQLQLPLTVSGLLLSGLRDKMKPLPPTKIPKRNGLLWFLPAWEIDWDFHCGAVGKWWMLDPLSSLNCLSAWIGWRAGCLKFFLLTSTSCNSKTIAIKTSVLCLFDSPPIYHYHFATENNCLLQFAHKSSRTRRAVQLLVLDRNGLDWTGLHISRGRVGDKKWLKHAFVASVL